LYILIAEIFSVNFIGNRARPKEESKNGWRDSSWKDEVILSSAPLILTHLKELSS
jgi:hypothetical protein